jgi:hypothetical protein
MTLEDIEKLLRRLRRNPRRTILLLAFAGILVLGGSFAMKYVEKQAENLASPGPNPSESGHVADEERLDYDVGGERANAKEYDKYIHIYNLSSTRTMYIKSVELRADMGNGNFRQAILYEPQMPEAIPPGSFKEFRYRLPNQTAVDDQRERSPEYATYTGKSFAYVYTTTGPGLVFETEFHPYFIDRLKLGRVAVVSTKSAVKVR